MQTRIHRTAAVALVIAAITVSGNLAADQIIMANGDVITGNISKIEDDKVFIDPSYADEFSVKLAEVVSIDADQTFEIELEDGSKVDASFAHGDEGTQTLVIEGEAKDVAMTDITLATEPEAWYDRDSKVEANLTWNDGNTDSRNNLIYANTSLKLGDHRHYGDLTFRRDKTDDVYTKKQDLLNYQYNWLFDDPWYMGGSFTWERDPIKDLDHRYTAGLLLGRDFFKDARRFLTASLGAGYSEEQYLDVSESGATGLWDLQYTHDFRDGDFELFHNHNINYQFFGNNNTIFKSTTGFNFDIIKDVYASISLRYDYETDPPEDRENADTTLAVGVGAKF